MATQVQLRRGTEAEQKLFTGAEGELTYTTDTKNLRVHDGQTMGGTVIPIAAAVPGLVIPDYANATVLIDPTVSNVPTTEQSFVAPKNGVVNVVLVGFNGNLGYLYINDVDMGQCTSNSGNFASVLTGQYLVPAGATVRFKSGYSGQIISKQQVIFYPLVG